MPAEPGRLADFLNGLQREFHRAELLSSDPLEFVHRFQDPWDQEAVALLSAVLAYGNVKQIRRSVQDALNRLGPPAERVRSLERADGLADAKRAFRGFVHRFNRGEDLVRLFELLARSWREHGSLGAHLISHLDSADESMAGALDALMTDWRAWAGRRGRDSFSYLLTSPKDGSACKRWCMFLRWMGRRDELDPGLWTEHGALRATFPDGRWLRASQLVIPMDTHTGRISRFIGLTSRKTLDWRAALEVTRNLKSQCDAEDPTRYDFALSRLGILDLCQLRYRPEICAGCQLKPACRFARAGESRARRRASAELGAKNDSSAKRKSIVKKNSSAKRKGSR